MRKKFCIILISNFLLFSLCFGKTFRKYDMSGGLSHNSVLCLTQTHDGLIMIGTRDGLCSFNGINYTVYKQNFDDKNSISNNQINCLFEADNGDLWIGTTLGLNRYQHNKDVFEKYFFRTDGKGLSHNYIRSIIETTDNKILIGSPSGIDVYDPSTNSFKKVPTHNAKTLNENSITCFFKDSKNKIWVGTRAGLNLYKDGELNRVSLSMNQNIGVNKFEIRDIKEDSAGKIWVATEEQGIFSFTIQSDRLVLSEKYNVNNSKLVSNHVRKIYFCKNEVWFGTMEGLSILNLTDKTFSGYQYAANNPEGISNNSIRDIFGDDQGGIWLATYAGGINYFHSQNNLFPHSKMTTSENNFLTCNVISGFLEEDNGDLWIATEGGGLIYREFSNNKSINYSFHENRNSLVHNNVKSLTRDKKGNLWIGTYNGLSYFNKQTKSFTNYQNQPENSNSLANNQVHSVFVDDDNLLWIGTNGGGLQTFDSESKTFKSVVAPNVKNVNVVTADHQNRLWVGHQGGLACIDRVSLKIIDLTSYLKQLPLTIQYVQSLYEDHQGRIWIGTQGFGLFVIQKDKILWLNADKGLPDNTINGILEDENGFFWLSTNKGLSKITYSDSGSKTLKLSAKTFSITQGLQGLQYYPMSTMKTKSGELYFGGVNGYNSFMPKDVDDNAFLPKIIISNIRVRSNSKEVTSHSLPYELTNSKEAIKLSYQFRDISVDFLGINYINPNNTFYRYRLINIDKDWVNIGTQRTLNFNYLPSGKYELRLQATTNSEFWDSTYKSLIFTILPPWWLTNWAFIGYFLLLILLLTAFFRLSQQWVNLNNQLAMEHFQREKEEELHQMKLKFFTDVSHELRTPLTLIVAPLEQIIKQSDLNSRLRNQLTLIQQNGNRMMRLINKVLDIRRLDAGYEKLKATSDDLVKFLEEISLAFKEMAGIKNIAFEFQSSETSLEVYFDRDKMEMILYNLLSNAIKNTSKDGKITLELKLTEGTSQSTDNNKFAHKTEQAVIMVTDNGRGIPGYLLDRIFERFFVSVSKENLFPLDSGVGLELTKRLVALHKGKIAVESLEKTPEKDGFTRFTVTLPMGKDHLTEDEIVDGFKNSKDSTLFSTSIQANEIINDSAWISEPVDQQTKISTNSSEKIRLLIVEDNLEVRSFIKSLFIEQYVVEEADNGIKGLEMAIDIAPDLIICDIMMPLMDGIELCKKIKTDIRISHIPVILLTARTSITFKYKGLETGADDYITKPFSAEYLQLRVRNLIRQREIIRSHFVRETICDPAKITVTSVDERLLKNAVDYIGNHMTDQSLSVEKLSSELGLSRVHLYRKIKALTNLTVVEFIRSIRLKRAAWLLSENKMNINEVSSIVGFDDVDYFRTCFKQHFGISPSEYSKQFKKDI